MSTLEQSIAANDQNQCGFSENGGAWTNLACTFAYFEIGQFTVKDDIWEYRGILRWRPNIVIPANKSIVIYEAYFKIYVYEYYSGVFTPVIYVRDENVADLCNNNETSLTPNKGSVNWSLGGSVGWKTSPSLVTLVQAWFDDSNYDPNDYLGFIISAGNASDDYVKARSNAAGSNKPILTLKYQIEPIKGGVMQVTT